MLRRAGYSEYSIATIDENGNEVFSNTFRVWESGYLEIPIAAIDDYRPGDASVGDLDGDGELDIVLHQASRGRDGSAGVTGAPVLDGYKLDGTHLWRIDLGTEYSRGRTLLAVYGARPRR